ncbi:MAG: recombination mediator RecR [Candidatus Cloacimonetes bacterium]|nr:recombination mediator RecR [Candidatus Cloacimonadota bacterium]
MLISPRLEELIKALNGLPGIGRKTAQRLAWYLLSADADIATDLAKTIVDAVQSYAPCGVCNLISESDPCPLCASTDRDDSQLCIVENSGDVHILENMNEYRGRYYVLGHLLSPLDGYGPEELGIPKLMELLAERKPTELILALKPTAEGEATIHYLTQILAEISINITRLSTGIPFGGELEYSSALTLANAWNRRYSVQ